MALASATRAREVNFRRSAQEAELRFQELSEVAAVISKIVEGFHAFVIALADRHTNSDHHHPLASDRPRVRLP